MELSFQMNGNTHIRNELFGRTGMIGKQRNIQSDVKTSEKRKSKDLGIEKTRKKDPKVDFRSQGL